MGGIFCYTFYHHKDSFDQDCHRIFYFHTRYTKFFFIHSLGPFERDFRNYYCTTITCFTLFLFYNYIISILHFFTDVKISCNTRDQLLSNKRSNCWQFNFPRKSEEGFWHFCIPRFSSTFQKNFRCP